MRYYIFILYKSIRYIYFLFKKLVSTIYTKVLLYINNVDFKKITSYGIPIIQISKNGRCFIGTGLIMNNGHKNNSIGRNSPCYIIVNGVGVLKIGENVGMSSCAINCHKSIIIGDNVLLGGGVCIYDTDFHSLDYKDRTNIVLDKVNTLNADVVIENNVFVGAHTTILKGVTLGENSIIGACSVVTKSIPSNEMWAGNPAKFIRKIV